MTSLETDRLVIRNFNLDDWQALLKMIVRYQASEMAMYDRPWPTTEDQIKGITEWFASVNSFMAVCLRSSGQLIGFVSLSPDEGNREKAFETGYVFDANFHGQGYATEGCQAILAYAFDEIGADKVVAGTAAVNLPSIRLLERLGFQKIGEEMVSFRKDEAGKPFEFLGYKYVLSREGWKNRKGIAAAPKVEPR